MILPELRKLLPEGGREVRYFNGVAAEVRADEDGKPGWTLAGHASVFNQETIIWGMFRESIEPGAFDDVLGDDVRHLLNHDPNLVLARTKSGTLAIEQDDIGLAFEAQLNPDDPDAVSARAKVLRGDVDQSSFAFTVAESSWEDEDSDDGTMPLRRITRIGRLFDTSTVTYPAYEGADSGMRSAVIEVLSGYESLDAAVRLRLLRVMEEAGDKPDALLLGLTEFERIIREAIDADVDVPDPEPVEAGPEGDEPDPGVVEAEVTDEVPEPDGGADEGAPDASNDDAPEGEPETDAERFEREAMERRHTRRSILTNKE